MNKPKKHKLTEEELKALLGKTCMGRQWFLMKKTTDFNKLALFLKINGVDRIELGQKAYTYEVDLKDETIGGAFILTEKPVGSVGADGKRIGDDAAGEARSRAGDAEAGEKNDQNPAVAEGDDATGEAGDQNPVGAGKVNGGSAGSRWYVAAAIVAPDHRGHDIGKIMSDKMKKLAAAEGANEIYVNVSEDTPCPDDMDGVEAGDAKAFWEAQGFVDWGGGLLVCAL
ncbi:MAG: GNAT family N-acetyltransferase [Eubacterium sp.]|nr:GNAT family N-acetyltransferase [Eubacterium sp.]